MKPCRRKALNSSSDFINQPIGLAVGRVKGSVQKLNQHYKQATIALFNKENFQIIGLRKPDENGNYKFAGLSTNLKTFIVAFDTNKQYNAVIQDNVVPK